MDSYKLFEAFEEEELFDVAARAEHKMDIFAIEKERKDVFVDYLIDELRRFFMDHDEVLEPIALHYIDRHWVDEHSDAARKLTMADDAFDKDR